jgi:hypothetical protein
MIIHREAVGSVLIANNGHAVLETPVARSISDKEIDMSSLPASSSPVELHYSTLLGPIVRESGKSRPISLDAIARDHGARAVDLIMEQPGHWVGIEPGTTPPSVPQMFANMADTVSQALSASRLPDLHPGTPESAKVRVEVRIVKDTVKAYLIELPDNRVPSRTAWIPRSAVGIGELGSAFGLRVFFCPLWLYRKLQNQL